MPASILPDDQSSLIITFDLTLSEGHETTADVTKHPVETGATIADHVIVAPPSLNLETFVSNAPLFDQGRGSFQNVPLSREASMAGQNAALATARVLVFDYEFDRVREVHQALLDIQTRGITSTVITKNRTYETMALVGLSMPITQPGGAVFTLNFQQIQTVFTSTVQAPLPLEKRGTPLKNKGGQATKDAKDPAEAESYLFKAKSALGKIL